MNQRGKLERKYCCCVANISRYSLAVLFSLVVLSNSGSARPSNHVLQIGQQSAIGQDTNVAVVEQALQEGLELYRQGTVNSLRQAVSKWEGILPLLQTVGNKQTEARVLNYIGRVYSQLGEKQKALTYYNQALSLRRTVGDRLGEANTLTDIGSVYSRAGEKWKALEYYNQALPLHRAVGDRAGEVATLNNIGSVYSELGENQKALEYDNQALPLARALADKSGEAIILNNIGGAYSELGEKQKALEYYNQALPLARAVRNRRGEATTLHNIGQVYSELGEKEKALEYYNQALPLRRTVGDKSGEAVTLNNIGQVYLELGEKEKALEYYNQALPLAQTVSDMFGEGLIRNNIGQVYFESGDKKKALVYYNQALPLIRAVGSKFGEGATLNNIAGVCLALGENQKALEYYNQALRLKHAIGDRSGEAYTLGNVGGVYFELGDKEKALAYYNQALPLSRAVGDRSGEAMILYLMAIAERNRGNLEQSLKQIEATIRIIEDLRANVVNEELQTSYFASVQDYYKFYIDLLMQLHKKQPSKGYAAQALHINERSRARSLTELLSEAHADIRNGVDPQLLAEEQRLQQLIDTQAKRLQELSSKPNTDAAIAKLKPVVENLVSQQEELKTKIRIASPKYAALKYPRPLKLPQIQQQLDPDTLLLEYSLGEEHSYLWLVSSNSLDTYELPARKQIEDAAQDFRQNLALPYASVGENKLSQIILAPIVRKLGNKRLVIVADGELQSIPFAALSESTPNNHYQPLFVNHEIVNLPSMTAIATQRQELMGRKRAPKTLAILADPVFNTNDPRVSSNRTTATIATKLNLRSQLQLEDLKRTARSFQRNGWGALPGTRMEAQAILKQISPTQKLQAFDFDANYNWATSKQLSQYQYIHFATHGFADPQNPELSGIVLSLVDKQGLPTPQGYLRLGDIFNLNFPAELVVLSACETGLGKDVQGEGLVGLTRGFMYAGAKSVAVSLWQVDDEATAQLMQELYKQMLQQGKSPAAALRLAQQQMWQDPHWNRPSYWAAFTLQGDWR